MKYGKLKVLTLSCFLAFMMASCKDDSACYDSESEELETKAIKLLAQEDFFDVKKISNNETDLDQEEGLRYIFTYSVSSDQEPSVKKVDVECMSSGSVCDESDRVHSSSCVIFKKHSN